MASDALVRLLLNTDQFDSKLKRSRSGVKGFGAEITSMSGLMKTAGAALTKLAGTIGVATSAVKLATDAFMASEANVDEWGRTIRAAGDIYDGFLTALNTGDISGYISNIDSIVSAARQAYNELDRLSTQQAINNPKIQQQRTENERLQAMLRTGRYIAPNDGRKASMADGQKLTQEQLKVLATQAQNGQRKLQQFVRADIAQQGRAIDALYNEQAKRLGLSLSEFMSGTADMGAFDERMAGVDKYNSWQAKYDIEKSRANAGIPGNYQYLGKQNPYQKYAAWKAFKDDDDLFKQINENINQRASLQSQDYSTTASLYRTMNRALGGGKGGRGGGGRGGKTPAQIAAEKLANTIASSQAEFNQFYVDDDLRKDEPIAKIDKAMDDLAKKRELLATAGLATEDNSLLPGLQVDTVAAYNEQIQSLTGLLENLKVGSDAYADVLERINILQDKMPENGKKTTQAWQLATQSIANVGSALQATNSEGLSVAGIVMQAIANIALGFSKQSLKAAGGGPLAWVAAVTSGLATMVATIASIKSATKYAEGGVVGGDSYSGDRLYARLNSGEVVLNQNQIARANAVMDSASSGGQGYVSGENIFIAMNNFGRRTGRGELVFSRR